MKNYVEKKAVNYLANRFVMDVKGPKYCSTKSYLRSFKSWNTSKTVVQQEHFSRILVNVSEKLFCRMLVSV